MAVVTSTELIQIARKNGWLLPAYNTTNMEMTLGILDGLQRAGMPGILQIAPTNVKLSDYGMIASIVKRAGRIISFPRACILITARRLRTYARRSRPALPLS